MITIYTSYVERKYYERRKKQDESAILTQIETNFQKKEEWTRWKRKMIKENKAKALQSLTIGGWINGLKLLNSKDEAKYQKPILMRT